MPIHSFEPGGVERVGLRLAEEWRSEGADVVVVLGRKRGAASANAPRLDYRTRHEPFPTDRWETIWLIWSLWRYLLRERADVIFCAGNTYAVVCVAMKLLLGRRCPPVLVKISNDLERRDMVGPYRMAYRLWLRVQGRMLDHFVGMAEPTRREIEHRCGVEPERVRIIPDPALSRAELERLAREREPSIVEPLGCRFLSMGRLVTQKNQALLLRAFAANRRASDRLTIVGDGPERARLAQLVGELDLGDQVELAGHSDDPIAAFHKADVFVLSSDYEGVPAVLIEAIAAGLPVVSTDCSASMGWLIGDGQFGEIVPRRDEEALGRAMQRARDITPCRRTMARFAGDFTLERAGHAYLDELSRTRVFALQQRFRKLRLRVRAWRAHGVYLDGSN